MTGGKIGRRGRSRKESTDLQSSIGDSNNNRECLCMYWSSAVYLITMYRMGSIKIFKNTEKIGLL